MNLESSEEELSQLYGSRKYAVLEKLAAHPNTSDKKLLELAKLGKPKSVYKNLAYRSSLSSEVQLAFYQHEPYLLLVNSNFPIDQEILRLAIRDNDEERLGLIFTYHQCDATTYELLAKKVSDEKMSKSILVNQKHCPREEVENIVDSVPDGNAYEYLTLYQAANNPNLSYKAAKTIMDKAFANRDPLLAERIAEHESNSVSAAAIERSGTTYLEMRKAIDRGVETHRARLTVSQ
jgi:hypothetical protein